MDVAKATMSLSSWGHGYTSTLSSTHTPHICTYGVTSTSFLEEEKENDELKCLYTASSFTPAEVVSGGCAVPLPH